MTSSITKPSPGVSIAGFILAAVILMAWAVLVAGLTSLNDSDAAGNGLSQAFAALNVVVVWLLLAVLVLIAAFSSAMPPWSAGVALVMIPASAYAAFVALGLLNDPRKPPFFWPLAEPAIVPPLIVLLCLWALIPALRRIVPSRLAGGATWGAILVLCLAILGMTEQRRASVEQGAVVAAKSHADLAALPANAPLWAWTPFLTANYPDANNALNHIRHMDRRQSDAEIMLARGDFPLAYLSRMDLDPTPSLCDKARIELRERVTPLILKTPRSRPYADIAVEVGGAAEAMEWLVGYGCSVNDESLAWEAMAKAYRDANFDVYRLAEMRDPKALGKILRDNPAKFSMLTPQAHLTAWLSFAGDKDHGAAALAGARKLDRRNADIIEMLNDKVAEQNVWLAMAYLPELDLEPTPTLCATALRIVAADIAKTYRPAPDDPRSYDELLSRLGRGDPLSALQWLAAHGCDAKTELADADTLVRSYRDSPERTAMLASLAHLRRAP